MEALYTQMYTSMSSCRQSFVSLDEEEHKYAAQFMAAGLYRLTRKYIMEHEKPDQAKLTELSYKNHVGEYLPLAARCQPTL